MVVLYCVALKKKGPEFTKYLLWTKEGSQRTKCCSRVNGNKVIKIRLILFSVFSCLSIIMWCIIFS